MRSALNIVNVGLIAVLIVAAFSAHDGLEASGISPISTLVK